MPSPSRLGRSSARKLVNCEKTSALCPSSMTSVRRGIRTSNFAEGSCARRGSISPLWQAAWRSRSSASRDCIFERFTPSRGLWPAPGGGRPAVAGAWAKPQQRLEDLHLRAVDAIARDPFEQRRPVVRAQLVVVAPLRAFELALERLLGAGRQFRRHLLLGAPEDERTQRPRQPLEVLIAAGPRRAGA